MKATYILLFILFTMSARIFGQDAQSFSTFHCISLYWKPAGAAADNQCNVKYRETGKSGWITGYSLWFDPNSHTGLEEHSQQYRGSLVDLKPGTAYEIELELVKTGTKAVLSQSTMSEVFKIGTTVKLDSGTVNQPLLISSGGSESEGYRLFDATGTNHTIDVERKHVNCIRVDASWVIIRGLTLKGALNHGIEFGSNVHHIVIEDCDISGWGSPELAGTYKGYGINLQSAIFSETNDTVSNFIIQRNKLHHPFADCNSWEEPVPSTHPRGAQAISIKTTKGFNIIRYNEIYSDTSHMFNDGMGNYGNFSFAGFPNRDSDIYGNKITHCWDDGIEAEGGGMNVRIWSNYSHTNYNAFAFATISLGPQYGFRNISSYSQRTTYPVAKYDRGGMLFKIGGESSTYQYAKGRIVLFHNTSLQPPTPWTTGSALAGAEYGIFYTSNTKVQDNIISRNNILHVRSTGNYSIMDYSKNPTNDFDYDFYSSLISAAALQETHGIKGVPKYNTSNPLNEYYLATNTTGHNQAHLLPGFNHAYLGTGPDMGAFEIGMPPMKYGNKADWNVWVEAADQLITSAQAKEIPSESADKQEIFTVFPNQITEMLTIRLLRNMQNASLRIYCTTGALVYSESLTGNTGETFSIDASKWSKGIYLVKISAKDGSGISKIIVQ